MVISAKNNEKGNEIGLAEFGAIVRFHRKKSGLTQLDLAKMAGIGKTAVFDIENNLKQPRLDTIVRVLAVLNISVRFEGPLMTAYEEHCRAEGKRPDS